MRNLSLISPEYHGVTVPEFWYMEIGKNNSLDFIFTKKCIELFEKLNGQNLLSKEFSEACPSRKKSWGEDGVMPALIEHEDRYCLSITLESQKDDVQCASICRSISEMLCLLGLYLEPEIKEKRKPVAGERLQLFSIETVCFSDKEMKRPSNWGLSLSTSPEVASFFMEHSLQKIPNVSEAMKVHHHAKFPKDKHAGSGLFSEFSGVLREKGTLHFITWGNCACMGAMPGEKEINEGLYLSSHNIDIAWQQLSMLTAIAVTWKWVRDALLVRSCEL